MKVKELKRRLEHFGTGIDDCEVILVRYKKTGELERWLLPEEAQMLLQPPEFKIFCGKIGG